MGAFRRGFSRHLSSLYSLSQAVHKNNEAGGFYLGSPPSCRTRARFPVPACNRALNFEYTKANKKRSSGPYKEDFRPGASQYIHLVYSTRQFRVAKTTWATKRRHLRISTYVSKKLPYMAPCVPKKQRFCLVLGVLLFCSHTKLVSASQNRPESTWKHQAAAIRPG